MISLSFEDSSLTYASTSASLCNVVVTNRFDTSTISIIGSSTFDIDSSVVKFIRS